MTPFRLILRNLSFYCGTSLAVAAGMAIATAVLTGAIMVGDSVKGSLAALAGRRTGKVDYALVAMQPFPDSLAGRVAQAGRFDVEAGLILTGGVAVGDAKARRQSGDVQILAVGSPAGNEPWVPVAQGSCLVNSELADALGMPHRAFGVGAVVLTFPSLDSAAREAVVARRDRGHAVKSLRVESSGVDDRGDMPALFNLNGSQRVPRNVWANLKELQDAIEQPGQANVLLVHDEAGKAADPGAAAAELDRRLREVIQLGDYGLTVAPVGAGAGALNSRSIFLTPATVSAAEKAAANVGVVPRLVSVNLLNAAVRLGTDGQSTDALHYIIVAGISSLDDGPIKDDEIAMNEPTARQMHAGIGDTVRLDYYQRRSNGDLVVMKSAPFHVGRVLPMQGLAADRGLSPTYKGMTDADSVSEWDKPLDLGIDDKIAARDNDQYWRRYKAAPRIFVSLATARKLWGGVYGQITSVRIPADKSQAFETQLRNALDPSAMGLQFRAVKAQQIAAASSGGANDFAVIFVSLSFFLIAAAALLVAMLFRLNIEQRARQVGLMAALGFRPAALRRLALAEGMILALAGSIAGLGLGVVYTWLIILGLRTPSWWGGAVGTTELSLYVAPMTLTIGLISGLAVAFAAVWWGVWRVGRTPPARLLAGVWTVQTLAKKRTGQILRWVGLGLVVCGIVFLAIIFAGVDKNAEDAMSASAALLAGALCWLAGALRPSRHRAALSTIALLGIRNASRHTARSVLSAGLIAFAVFTLVIVAAMRQAGPGDIRDPHSASGGYQLFVRASVPLLGDISTPEGRKLLGLSENNLLTRARFLSMRRWAGEDISCLNLSRPTSPTILAVPHELIDHPRFSFTSAAAGENPWKKLDVPIEMGKDNAATVPVAADDQTARYILHLDVGKSMQITGPDGQPINLKLVATLKPSVFQGELLMGEENFRQAFPSQSGFGVILAETPANDVVPLEQLLNDEMGDDYGLSVDTTAARIASYQAVENTYLSTFQVLGSLGLMLGTIGLAVVVIRNVIERRGELALLTAMGFTPIARGMLVLSENAFLLVVGLLVGTGCALLGIMPTILSNRGGIAWLPLALTLLAVFVIGLAASAIAVRLVGLRTRPQDLRSE